MKVVTVFPSFALKGGAEDMAVSLARGLNPASESIVLQIDSKINSQYAKSNIIFENFNIRNIRKYHNEGMIFLSHHRKTTTFLLLISRFFFLNKLKVVHVAHNTYSNLKRVTLFPTHNIAVSKSVKKNMVSFFKVKEKDIKVIYNGIHDYYNPENTKFRINQNSINILFLGRLDPIKRQVAFVNETRGKLNSSIKIYFGGVGKDFEILKKAIGDFTDQYILLGLIDVYKELHKFDYVCLFSEKEGLPLSLIEGQMFKKPLVTNDLPQCKEINRDGYNGYVTHSWEEVINCINHLPFPNDSEYLRLSENARKTFEEKFNFGKMISLYREYIGSITWK